MTMSSSSHHHFVLCLFLLGFLSVNSQRSLSAFVVILKNEISSMVEIFCMVDGKYHGEGEIELKSGGSYNITKSIDSRANNTLGCFFGLREKYGFFKLFTLNDTSICHTPDEECL
ncbi:hypothetical protein H5410_048358 [Solanum commersonii]|uniref:S-protein homolog n=1 Tax=Solanum commersonii TaxID=4109 RepID=A0A9J5XKV7_SOLCO|nr:hypothetical protein H5410_048358 [Solanum commersonii]